MGRRRKEPITQHQLTYELSLEIDKARDNDRWDEVDYLIRTYPLGVASSYVRHNIGPRRLVWLESRARAL